jgi:hypothetical protein
MKCIKLFAVLLSSLSLVSAAAFHIECDGDDDVGPFTQGEYQQMLAVVQEGDDPEALADFFRDSYLTHFFEYNDLLATIIRGHRIRSFQFLLSLMEFSSQRTREEELSLCLSYALQSSSFEIADVLLAPGNDFVIRPSPGHPTWHSPSDADVPLPAWHLEDLKGLVSRHPEKADALAPSEHDLLLAGRSKEAILLIELARHCDAVSMALGKPPRFDPTDFLSDVIADQWYSEEDMLEVVMHLLDLGAIVTPDLLVLLDDRNPGCLQTRQFLEKCLVEPVKGTSADCVEDDQD